MLRLKRQKYALFTFYILSFCFFFVLTPNIYESFLDREKFQSLLSYISVIIICIILTFVILSSSESCDLFEFNLIDLSVLLIVFYVIISCMFVNNQDVESFLMLMLQFFLWFLLRAFIILIRKAKIQIVFFKSIIVVFSIVFTYSILYGFLQFLGLYPSHNPHFNFTGYFSNPARFLMFCTLILPSFLHILSRLKNNWIIFSWGIIFVIYLVLLLYSEVQIAWIVSIFIIFSYFFRGKNLKRLRPQINCILGIVIIIIIYYVLNSNSGQGRLLIWRISFNIWNDYPYLGAGFGSFEGLYTLYQSQYFSSGINADEQLLADVVRYPYNEFLKILCENGIIGLILVLFFICTIILVYINEYRPGKINNNLFMLLPLLSAFIFSLVSYPFSEPSIRLLLLLFLSIYASNIKPLIFIRINFKFFLIFLMIFIVSSIITAQTILNKFYAYKKWEMGSNYSLDIGELDLIYDYLKDDEKFVSFYVISLNLEKQFSQSLKVFENNYKFLRTPYSYINLYHTFIGLNNLKKAEEALIFSINMVPIKLAPRYYLMKHYLEFKDLEKTVVMANDILSTPVKVQSVDVDYFKMEAKNILDSLSRHARK